MIPSRRVADLTAPRPLCTRAAYFRSRNMFPRASWVRRNRPFPDYSGSANAECDVAWFDEHVCTPFCPKSDRSRWSQSNGDKSGSLQRSYTLCAFPAKPIMQGECSIILRFFNAKVLTVPRSKAGGVRKREKRDLDSHFPIG